MNDAELARQFRHAKDKGWLPAFLNAGYGLPPCLLMAIASRETNMQNIIGDHGHGHGLMQIDDRSFPEWCRSGKWRVAVEAVRMGAFVLRSKFNDVEAKHIPKPDRLRVAVAAYNTGPNAIADYLIHHDPDYRTADRNYSKDVMKRVYTFKKLLAANAMTKKPFTPIETEQ